MDYGHFTNQTIRIAFLWLPTQVSLILLTFIRQRLALLVSNLRMIEGQMPIKCQEKFEWQKLWNIPNPIPPLDRVLLNRQTNQK